jgi:hypothetical protein
MMYEFDDVERALAEDAERQRERNMVEPIDDPAVLCDFYDYADIVGIDVDDYLPVEYT